METVTIEFEANEEQDWFFHCHILYTHDEGMARIVSYEGSGAKMNLQNRLQKLKRR